MKSGARHPADTNPGAAPGQIAQAVIDQPMRQSVRQSQPTRCLWSWRTGRVQPGFFFVFLVSPYHETIKRDHCRCVTSMSVAGAVPRFRMNTSRQNERGVMGMVDLTGREPVTS